MTIAKVDRLPSDALAHYYARRAGEYDSIYARPERQEDLRRLTTHLMELLAGRHVLEVACGTGFWTQRIAAAAAHITATEINEEMLAIARTRLTRLAHAHLVRADAHELAGIERRYSGALAAFWWSHLHLSDIGKFLDVLHSRLLPGARVIFADNCYVEGSSTPISRRDAQGNTYQWRRLADGTQHEVLKNFTTEPEFRQSIGHRGVNLRFERFTYFWCGSYDLTDGSPL